MATAIPTNTNVCHGGEPFSGVVNEPSGPDHDPGPPGDDEFGTTTTPDDTWSDHHVFLRVGRRTADPALPRPSAHGRAAPSVTLRAGLSRRTRSVRPWEPPFVASGQSTRRTAAAASDLPQPRATSRHPGGS